jgi:RpiB/LacA/LacB family sugar-phosphate isomerase
MRIGIASDHAGFQAKEMLKAYLRTQSYKVKDFGTDSDEPVDYPDLGAPLCCALQRDDIDWGILICGSGIGMSITANRFHEVRAALCHDSDTAALAREHNDANVLVLGSRSSDPTTWPKMVERFISTPFAKGRHKKRLEKIQKLPHCDLENDHEDLYD